jgi:diacylglycerol kinase family enzyme
MRIALAANAASGGGVDVDALAAALAREGAGVVADGCDAAALERLAAARPERVAVAGGDGTIGPAAALAGRLGVPLAVLPAGTANDFARVAGLPDGLDDAVALAVRGRELRRLDLGRLADGHPFVNVASAGMGPAAAHRARPLKRRLGPLAYAAGALRAALTERPLPVEVRLDGSVAYAGAAWQLMVGVTGAFGAGSTIGGADPTDGRLHVSIVPAGSRFALAAHALAWRTGRSVASFHRPPGSDPKLQSRRHPGSDPKVQSRRHPGSDPKVQFGRREGSDPVGGGPVRARVVEVRLPAGADVNVDGEIRSGGLERVTVQERAFALVVG